MKSKIIFGFVLVAIASIIFFWAQNHSPNSGIGTKLMNEFSGSFTLSRKNYTISMVISVVLAIFGVYKIFKN